MQSCIKELRYHDNSEDVGLTNIAGDVEIKLLLCVQKRWINLMQYLPERK